MRSWPMLVGAGFGMGQSYQERYYAYNAYRYKHNVFVPEQSDSKIGRFAKCMQSNTANLWNKISGKS